MVITVLNQLRCLYWETPLTMSSGAYTMPMKPIPLDFYDLREMLDYNATTGAVAWTRSRKVHPRYRGKPIATVGQDGYIRVQIDGRQYAVHRLAWYLAYGVQPRGRLVHRNGDKTDNRLDNLAEANRSLEPLCATVVFGTPPAPPRRPPWE